MKDDSESRAGRSEMLRNNRQWVTQAALAVVGASLGVTLGWLAVRGIAWDEVRAELTGFPPGLLLLALALLMLSFYLRAWRWRLLWSHEKVSAFRLFLVENASLGLNNLSPIRALDEPVMFGILYFRDRLPIGSIIATMMMTRLLDLAFTLLFVGVAILSLPALLRFAPAVAFTAMYFLAWMLILLNLSRILKRFPRLQAMPAVQTFQQALGGLKSNKMRMARSFFITCAYWLLLAPIGWLIAVGVGIDLAFYNIMFVVMGSIFFGTAVPGLPGAIGTFQFGVTSLLGLFDVPDEKALTFAIILHAILFLPPTVFSIIVLPREGVGSIATLRGLIVRAREARHS